MEYRKVVLEGRFLHDKEMRVGPRTIFREMFTGTVRLGATQSQVTLPRPHLKSRGIGIIFRLPAAF